MVNPLIGVLASTLTELNEEKEKPLFPSTLYRSFANKFGYVNGRQNHIHKSLTSLYGSEIADQFSGLYQYDKCCLDCPKKERIYPENFFQSSFQWKKISPIL